MKGTKQPVLENSKIIFIQEAEAYTSQSRPVAPGKPNQPCRAED